GTVISAAVNAASYQPIASPGMILAVFGEKLSETTQNATGAILPYKLAGVTAVVNGISAPIAYVSSNQVNIQVPQEVGAGPAVLGINNNGQIAGFALDVTPAAPGIFVDPGGSLSANATVKQGGTATLFFTGAGEVTPLTLTGRTSNAALAAQAKPALPLT